MAKWVFIFAFCISIFFQGLRWLSGPLDDGFIWRSGADVFQNENPKFFPKLDAYMHPGGPVILGTVVTQSITKSNYSESLGVFFTIFDSLAIAVLCTVCFLSRRQFLWPITVLGLLSLQPLYPDASLYQGLTPPSIIVALLLPIFILLTLYLYENPRNVRNSMLGLWALLAGFIVATRIDIGGIMVVAFLALLIGTYDLKKLFLMAFASFLAFCAFDPFMWFDPITQIKALIFTVGNHYGGYIHFVPSYPLSFFENVGFLSVVSMFLAMAFILLPKRLSSPVPVHFLSFLLAVTIIVYEIFFTANTQAYRYVLPLVFVWEVLLPLFLFSLISQIPLTMLTTQKSKETARLCLSLITVLFLLVPPSSIFSGDVLKNEHQVSGILKEWKSSSFSR